MRITARRLKQLVSYSSVVGVFEWRAARPGAAQGGMAGTVNETGYLQIGIDGHQYRAHQLAWLYATGAWPETEIDHVDGDKLNNALSNLRLSNRAENCWNAKRNARNTSGVKGVSFDSKSGRWDARIRCNGNQHYIGRFTLIDQAAAAVAAKRQELHGEFARHA